MRRSLLLLVISTLVLGSVGYTRAQGVQSSVTTDEVQQALSAVASADTYQQFLDAVTQHQRIFGDPQSTTLIDQALASGQLDDAQRNLLLFDRLLAQDIRQYDVGTAVQFGVVRLIAATAMGAQSPAHLAVVMDKFTPMASAMSAELVSAALSGSSWPPALLPLMQQLGQDWPAYGSLAAATRMSESAGASAQNNDDSSDSNSGQSWEDRTAERFLESGQPIPDGLIHMPQ